MRPGRHDRGGTLSPPVITGCGTINALGAGTATFWARLIRGESGIGPVPQELGESPQPVAAAVTHEIPATDGWESLSRTDALALVAAREAVSQARLIELPAADRVAVVVGTTTGGLREIEAHFLDRAQGKPAPRARLLHFEKASTADVLARHFGFTGPRFTLHSACASSASAIALAADLIGAGMADAVLAGGSDALTRFTFSGFRSLRLLDPGPCRPFDRRRAGLSLGEGAGMLVVETRTSATMRRAPILAELLSAAQTTDAHHLTAPAPDGSGAARAMRSALDQAGLAAGSVDHVNAHGTGTLANDAVEARALRDALGDRAPTCPISGIKGSIGHTLGAAGAIEALAAIRTLMTGLLPPTAGLREVDPELGIEVVRHEPRAGNWRVVLSNSFGFGGSNTVLCFGRAES